MDLIAINGDEPRLYEFFVLARLANAAPSDSNSQLPVMPVKTSTGDLMFMVFENEEFICTYEEMFDRVWDSVFSSKESMQQWISEQARIGYRLR